jgi:hypothetical protein
MIERTWEIWEICMWRVADASNDSSLGLVSFFMVKPMQCLLFCFTTTTPTISHSSNVMVQVIAAAPQQIVSTS